MQPPSANNPMMATIARMMEGAPDWSAVVAYQPWLKGERGELLGSFRGAKRTRNLEIPGLVLTHHPGMTAGSIPGGENPVATGLQSDGFAGLEFPVAGCVDLDHGLALAAAERDFGSLDRTKGADVTDRALERAAAGRPDLHVMAPNEQLCGP